MTTILTHTDEYVVDLADCVVDPVAYVADVVEVVDLVPARRRHAPATLDLLAQRGVARPATTLHDAAQSRRRAVLGLYVDARA